MKNELRINNWVKLKDSDPIENYQVTQILERGVNCGAIGCLYEMVEPIPLTEEWLERFGFERKPSGLFVKDGVWFLSESQVTIDAYCFGELMQGTYCELNYVNQLQNLYFALTGQELTIKELA